MVSLIAFIAPTQGLLAEQKVYLENNCSLRNVKAKEFNGDSTIGGYKNELWYAKDWNRMLNNCEVNIHIF